MENFIGSVNKEINNDNIEAGILTAPELLSLFEICGYEKDVAYFVKFKTMEGITEGFRFIHELYKYNSQSIIIFLIPNDVNCINIVEKAVFKYEMLNRGTTMIQNLGIYYEKFNNIYINIKFKELGILHDLFKNLHSYKKSTNFAIVDMCHTGLHSKSDIKAFPEDIKELAFNIVDGLSDGHTLNGINIHHIEIYNDNGLKEIIDFLRKGEFPVNAILLLEFTYGYDKDSINNIIGAGLSRRQYGKYLMVHKTTELFDRMEAILNE